MTIAMKISKFYFQPLLAPALSGGIFVLFIEGAVIHLRVKECMQCTVLSLSKACHLDSFQIFICKIRMFSKRYARLKPLHCCISKHYIRKL